MGDMGAALAAPGVVDDADMAAAEVPAVQLHVDAPVSMHDAHNLAESDSDAAEEDGDGDNDEAMNGDTCEEADGDDSGSENDADARPKRHKKVGKE